MSEHTALSSQVKSPVTHSSISVRVHACKTATQQWDKYTKQVSCVQIYKEHFFRECIIIHKTPWRNYEIKLTFTVLSISRVSSHTCTIITSFSVSTVSICITQIIPCFTLVNICGNSMYNAYVGQHMKELCRVEAFFFSGGILHTSAITYVHICMH